MFSDLEFLQPFLLIGAFWLLIVPHLSRQKDAHRMIITGLAFLFALRYFVWRLLATVLDSGSVWIWIVYLLELLAFFEVAVFLLIMSRNNNRSAEADRYEKEFSRIPSVDVFIPTYNEGPEVLEKSILGAKHLDYPDFKVWVLDDGKRNWLKDFCRKHEVGYLTRPDNLHAKAGNLNNGLSHTGGELIAVFDADFVPTRIFLKRTVVFFLQDETVGIVQTPQHFFNRDPIQLNLGLEKLLPDEQRLFFDAMAPSRDAWGAAFCCGSCSVLRRKALEKIGGIPTSSITEDLLTTLSLLTVDYKTIYLNEALSFGMSSESLQGYFIQRARWCRGGIQCFFVKEGPLRAKGLTMLQRILFSPYSWILQPVTRIMMLMIPIVYLFLDWVPLKIKSSEELIAYQFPLFLLYFLTMRWLVGRKYVPLITSAINIFGMFRLLPVMLSSLIKPFGVPFRVTPKGNASITGTDWYVFGSVCVVIALSFLGLAINLIPEYRIIQDYHFFHYVVFWTCFNIFLLSFSLLLCFDAPKKAESERFVIREAIKIGGKACTLETLSLKDGTLSGSTMVPPGEYSFTLTGVRTPIHAEKKDLPEENILELKELSDDQREDLIVKLYTGNYDNEIHEPGKVLEILKNLLKQAYQKN